MADLYPRIVERLVAEELLPNFPAVFLVGPRGVGKSTTAGRLVDTVIDLSEPGPRQAARDDPDGVLAATSGTVVIDEWQEAPEILAAVKRAVDADRARAPGRFIVTGSARATFSSQTWPGTGRLIRVRMYGLTQSELAHNNAYNPIDTLFAATAPAFATSQVSRASYIDRIVAGRFPAALRHSGRNLSRWFDAYAEQLAERDAPQITGGHPRARLLRGVLRSCAARTGRELNKEAVARDAEVARATADSHVRLLEDLSIVVLVPAWHSNRIRRLTRSPRLHLTDPGLATHLLNADAETLTRDGILIGQLFETFVAAELLAHIETASAATGLFHYRNRDGREIDFLLERRGRVVGIEVKSATSVSRDDARHLMWLRDRLGGDFHYGAVLYSGQIPYRIDGSIWALPISALWQPPHRTLIAAGEQRRAW
ncbi:MAG: ATP-binding protein [Acidimicrobiia bacterium]|nr:ATP-binding protein [Acidimicrobiia bacterium]